MPFYPVSSLKAGLLYLHILRLFLGSKSTKSRLGGVLLLYLQLSLFVFEVMKRKRYLTKVGLLFPLLQNFFWLVVSGRHTLRSLFAGVVGFQAELVEANGEEECYPAVTNLCASRDGSMIAVAIQSFHGVMLLSCDLSLKALAVTRVVPIEDSFIPACLGISYSAENLWLVTGASNLPSSGSLPLACVRVISRLRNRSPDSGELGPVMLKDESVPGGEKLLEKLQGSVNSSKQEMALAAAAEAVKMQCVIY